MYPLVSVIMPVYNAEKYLHRAVDSILQQTMKEWELILVDDGSTDSSPTICDEYANADKRIRVFHKENGGVSTARQLGTNVACGEYSIHCDSDDWVEPMMLEEMYMEAKRKKADIVISDFYYDFSDGKCSECHFTVSTLKGGDILKDILRGHAFGGLWHKMIKHSLYSDFGISYVDGVNYCEDVLILAQLFHHDVSITCLNKAYYHYCMENEESITRNYTSRTFLMRQMFIKALREIRPEDEYKSAIDTAALLVKTEAISRGFLKWKDINSLSSYMRTTISAPFDRVYGKRLKIKYVFWFLINLLS